MDKPACPLCGEEMEVGATKQKQKPHAACYPCGVQLFVRGARGVALFEKKFGPAWRSGKSAPEPAPIADPLPAPKPAPAPAPVAADKKGGKSGNFQW